MVVQRETTTAVYDNDSVADRDQHYVTVYDQQASGYDARSFSSTGGGFSKRYKNSLILQLLKQYGVDVSTVLDCPAGTGRVTHFAATDFGCDEIIACDISPNMLEKNRQSLPTTNAKVTFHVANMKSLPLSDASVSVACVTSFFYLIPREEYSAYLSDIHRVLKPGGLAIVEVSNVLPSYNPMNLFRVLKERFIERRSVKSYVGPLEFAELFKPFEVIGYRGAEFPLISKRYGVYVAMSRILGGTPILKWFSGKFTIVLRKSSSC